MYIYENHLFNFYKYHYITNVSVLIMQNLLDILKSLIWLLFWKTKWLLIDNFCQERIYVPFFFFCKKIYIPDSWTPKKRNTPKHSKATTKTKPFFRVILKWILIIWMELPHIYTTRWIKTVDGNHNKKWSFILAVTSEN